MWELFLPHPVYFPFPQPLLKIRFISKNQHNYSPSIFTICRKVPFSIIVDSEQLTRLIPNRPVYPYPEAVRSQRCPVVKTLTWWRYIPAALPSLLTQHWWDRTYVSYHGLLATDINRRENWRTLLLLSPLSPALPPAGQRRNNTGIGGFESR
jgi:hypothetical protein